MLVVTKAINVPCEGGVAAGRTHDEYSFPGFHFSAVRLETICPDFLAQTVCFLFSEPRVAKGASPNHSDG